MTVKSFNVLTLAVLAGLAAAAGACGDLIRQDRSPVVLVVDRLEGASGASGTAGTFSGTLQSDVLTGSSVFSDAGRVTVRMIMKDIGASPSSINAVTMSRYTVEFTRVDGRNTPGVDVPFPFDSTVTFTVQPGSAVTQPFELIRHVAKLEAPLAALAASPGLIISTNAKVTFYGRDQAGNDVSASGSMGVQFGNFADPQ
ncbi:MAG: hypothetical protein HY824_07970 [Acidobacteria bacterium]|nr:hypothetical protein [Acidobacteriota bacterium]